MDLPARVATLHPISGTEPTTRLTFPAPMTTCQKQILFLLITVETRTILSFSLFRNWEKFLTHLIEEQRTFILQIQEQRSCSPLNQEHGTCLLHMLEQGRFLFQIQKRGTCSPVLCIRIRSDPDPARMKNMFSFNLVFSSHE